LPGHRVSLPDGGEVQASRMLAAIRAGGVMPPSLSQMQGDLRLTTARVAEIVAVLQQRGEVVKVAADLAFAYEVVEGVERRMRAHLEQAGEITAAELRDLIGASRKYSIPLLDYFDHTGVTVRSGDLRRLREK